MTVPFGDVVLSTLDTCIGSEVCEELWSPKRFAWIHLFEDSFLPFFPSFSVSVGIFLKLKLLLFCKCFLLKMSFFILEDYFY